MGRTKKLSEETYDKLCATLTEFENDKCDLKWCKVFYDLCVEMQREMNFTEEE